MAEQWKPVPGFGDYEVSEHGSVRNVFTGRVLRPMPHEFGYRYYQLHRSGRRHSITEHRIVALAFLGEPPTDQHHAAHNDGSKTNNHYSNLRWATQKENQADRTVHGTDLIGNACNWSKLNESGVIEIRRKYKSGKFTQEQLARDYGVTFQNISAITRGLTWKHVA